jgi:hypothetical protein
MSSSPAIIRKVTGLTVLAAGTSSSQALVVQVVQEGSQQLSSRRQPGVQIPCQLVCRVIAFVCSYHFGEQMV